MAKTAILTKDGLVRYDSNIKDYIKDLTDDTIYIDPDETTTEIENIDSVTSAKLVSYSNANSGLEATNVQEAIDGVNEKTDNINTYLQRNSSSKNLLKPTIASHTYGGVTITVNSDKSITLNGTTTGGGLVTIGQVQLEADTEYIYSVNPSKNMPDGWFSQVTHRDGQSFVNVSTYGEDITFTNAGAVLKSFIYFHLGVSGTVYNNITFYPMIRLSSIEDDTYQPYYEDTMSSVNYLNDKVNYLSNELSTVSTSVNSLKYNALVRTDVVDNLSSTATSLPLSANQGRVISEKISANYISATDVYIDNYISNDDLRFWVIEYTDYVLVSIVAKFNETLNSDSWTTVVSGLPNVARIAPLNVFNPQTQGRDISVIYSNNTIIFVTQKDRKYVNAGEYLYISGMVVK